MQSEILGHFYNRQAFYKLFRAIFASKFAKIVYMRQKKIGQNTFLGINLLLIANRLKKFEKSTPKKVMGQKSLHTVIKLKNFFVDNLFRMKFLASFQQIQNRHRLLCSLIPILKSVKKKNNLFGPRSTCCKL
jgi:hypothetical protein